VERRPRTTIAFRDSPSHFAVLATRRWPKGRREKKQSKAPGSQRHTGRIAPADYRATPQRKKATSELLWGSAPTHPLDGPNDLSMNGWRVALQLQLLASIVLSLRLCFALSRDRADRFDTAQREETGFLVLSTRYRCIPGQPAAAAVSTLLILAPREPRSLVRSRPLDIIVCVSSCQRHSGRGALCTCRVELPFYPTCQHWAETL